MSEEPREGAWPAAGQKGQASDMTRERARAERRDLDNERGEPVAGSRGSPARRVGRPARRLDSPAPDPGHQRRWHRIRGLLALKQALDPIGEVTVVAPDTNQTRGRPPEDADAPAPRPGADAGGRLDRLLGRRIARPTA